MQQLRGLFERDFRFEVDEIHLMVNGLRPQEQLDKAIKDLIARHDGREPENLLIVYYTGHAYALTAEPDEVVFSG